MTFDDAAKRLARISGKRIRNAAPRTCGREEYPPARSVVEFVALCANSRCGIVRTAQTEVLNDAIDTGAVIGRLRKLDRKYEIDIFQPAADTLSFQLPALPADMPALCCTIVCIWLYALTQVCGDEQIIWDEIRKPCLVRLRRD